MAVDVTVFKDLKDLSSDLEQNLNLLEFEVSDATKLLYNSENKLKTDSKGISILQEVLKRHTKIRETLETLFQNEESDLDILNEELDTFTNIVNDHEKEQEGLEQILIEQNLIQPEQSVLSSDECSNGAEHNGDIPASSSPQPPTSCDSTFLIPPLKPSDTTQTPDSVCNDFQSTICEFGYGNSSINMGKKTLVVKKNSQ